MMVEVCAGLFRSSAGPGSFSEAGPLRDSGHLSVGEARGMPVHLRQKWLVGPADPFVLLESVRMPGVT